MLTICILVLESTVRNLIRYLEHEVVKKRWFLFRSATLQILFIKKSFQSKKCFTGNDTMCLMHLYFLRAPVCPLAIKSLRLLYVVMEYSVPFNCFIAVSVTYGSILWWLTELPNRSNIKTMKLFQKEIKVLSRSGFRWINCSTWIFLNLQINSSQQTNNFKLS